jgi:HEAT repeat protein
VRMQVATGLGQIAATNAMHTHTPQVIPVLERLSRDRHLETRYQAIVALGQIKSDRVIPILTSALHSPSSRLVKAASSALGKLNYSAPEPEPLELPKKVVYRKPLI